MMRVALSVLTLLFSVMSFAQFEPRIQRYNIYIKRSERPRYFKIKIEAQISDIKQMRIDKDFATIVFYKKKKRKRSKINFSKRNIQPPEISVGSRGEVSFEIELPKKRGVFALPVELIGSNDTELRYWLKVSLRKKPYRMIISNREKKKEEDSEPEKPLEDEGSEDGNKEEAIDYSRVKNRFATSVGGGVNYLDFQQANQNPQAKTAFSSILFGSTFFDFQVNLSQEWVARLESRSSPGSISSDKEGELLVDGKYSWRSSTLETIYINRDSAFSIFDKRFFTQMRLGLQTHGLPLLVSKDQGGGVIGITGIDRVGTNNLSIGAGFFWQGKWRAIYEYFLRYQYVISSKSDYEIKPELVFDGSLGFSVPYDSGFRWGVYWYGQYHGFKYSHKDADNSATGNVKLLYSNIDFRLGYEF